MTDPAIRFLCSDGTILELWKGGALSAPVPPIQMIQALAPFLAQEIQKALANGESLDIMVSNHRPWGPELRLGESE